MATETAPSEAWYSGRATPPRRPRYVVVDDADGRRRDRAQRRSAAGRIERNGEPLVPSGWSREGLDRNRADGSVAGGPTELRTRLHEVGGGGADRRHGVVHGDRALGGAGAGDGHLATLPSTTEKGPSPKAMTPPAVTVVSSSTMVRTAVFWAPRLVPEVGFVRTSPMLSAVSTAVFVQDGDRKGERGLAGVELQGPVGGR